MSFPNPPVPNQEYTHSNGITYIYDATNNSWEIKYEQATNTASLPLVNPSGRYMLTGGASLPDSGGLLTQSDYNTWAFNSLVKVDETSRVDAGESAPGDADTNQLWYKPSTGSLYVYYHDGSSAQWVEIGGGSGPSNTYRIETDPMSGYAQIQLVDQDDNFTNVHFTASGDLTVLSTASKIEYGVDLTDYATETYVNDAIAAIPDPDLSEYATIAKSEADDANLQNQIDELEIVKGAVATYDCVDTSLGLTNARSGECIFSDATSSAVIIIGFGVEDKNGNLTRPIANGDIVEVVAPGGTVSRYAVNDNASAPAMVAVTFASGDQSFSSGTEYSVYIYPQNAAGVSKDYVDSQDDLLQAQITANDTQKVSKSGDTMTGDLSFDGSSNSVRMLSGSKLRFTGSDPGGNQRTFIDIKNELSSGTEGADDGYRMYLYHLATPSNPYHASNKKYVDESIAAIPSVNLDGYATEQYVDDAISAISVTGDYLPLSGGELTGDLKFKEGNKADHQFIINPNSSTPDTNIYGLNGGQVRFRTSHTSDENDRQGSHIVLDPNGGTPETKIYNVVDPTNNTMATSKSYVDGKVGNGEFFQQGGALYYNTAP